MFLLFALIVTAASADVHPDAYGVCSQVYDLFSNSPYRNLAGSASNAAVGQYPFAVSFQRKTDKVHICSGVFAGENNVLTSGQCGQIFLECNRDEIEAVLGGWSLNDPEEMKEHQQRIKIGQITLALNYTSKPPPYLAGDTAIITLSRSPVLNNRVQPLQYFIHDSNPTQTLAGKTCKVISWGNKHIQEQDKENEISDSPTKPNILQQEDVLLIENQECSKMMESTNLVDEGMLCGLKLPLVPNGVVDCEDARAIWKPTGDTGGALICSEANEKSVPRYFLAGTTSWGNIPCNRQPTKRVLVFTRMSHYIGTHLYISDLK